MSFSLVHGVQVPILDVGFGVCSDNGGNVSLNPWTQEELFIDGDLRLLCAG
jgi:hypothetical protein